MEQNNLIKLIKRKKRTILSVALLFLLVILIITVAQPLKYRATSKILVTLNYGPTADAYSVSKANQFIGNILAQVVYSDVFFEDALNSGFNIDKTYFPARPDKRKEKWEKTVNASVFNDAGMIVIDTYHPDKFQAEQINQAIGYNLKKNHANYHGLGSKVEVKIIDKAISSNFPVKPNIFLNLVFGIVFGVLFGVGFVQVFPNIDFSLWPKRGGRQKHAVVSADYDYLGNGGRAEMEKEFARPILIEETFSADSDDGAENIGGEENSRNEENDFPVKGDMRNIF